MDLCTIEFIWVKGNPLNCHDKMISSQHHLFRDRFFTPKRTPGQNVDPGRQSIFHTFMTDFFTGSWHASNNVRLEKRVPLLRISLGDLPICPFGGQQPFSTQPNPQIQDWVFFKDSCIPRTCCLCRRQTCCVCRRETC